MDEGERRGSDPQAAQAACEEREEGEEGGLTLATIYSEAEYEAAKTAAAAQVCTYDDDGNGTIEGAEFYRHFVK